MNNFLIFIFYFRDPVDLDLSKLGVGGGGGVYRIPLCKGFLFTSNYYYWAILVGPKIWM